MRRPWVLLAFLLGCGKDDVPITADAPNGMADAAPTCQPQSAVGAFYRRSPNPRLVAGRMFTDGKLDTAIADPDLHWDGSAWHLYYSTPHASSFSQAGPPIIRHATSTDLATWSFDDAPSLTVADAGAWDATHIAAPTVLHNPDAPSDRRYLMLYSGASAALPGHPFPAYAIGAAISADGKTFTRVASPKGMAGLVLTGAEVYPGAGGAIVTDPEVVLVGGTYHLWFSSLSCSGADCATIEASGIGHATSSDGVSWSVDAAPVPSLLRASADKRSGGARPAVLYDDVHCKWEMWLTSDAANETTAQAVGFDNMAGVWHATSINGSTWNINYNGVRDLIWDSTASGEHLGLRGGADIARKGTGRYMVYVGYDDQNVPIGSVLPDRSDGFTDGVMTLNVATRDAP